MVLNKNEDPKKIQFRRNLEEGIYLITQKRYGGKALDIAFIKVSKYGSEMIGGQISIHKKGIFSRKKVEKYLCQLQENMKYYYNLKVKDENLYFCYIFDYNYKHSDMVKKCKSNGMKYIFYDITNDCFKDDKGNKITKLKQHLLRLKSVQQKITYYFKNKEIININNKTSEQDSKIFINNAQKATIIKLFQRNLKQQGYELEEHNLDIQYQNTQTNLNSDFIQNNDEFCVAEYEDKEYTGSIAMITNLIKVNLIKSNGQIFAYNNKLKNKYDYYKVVQKDNENDK